MEKKICCCCKEQKNIDEYSWRDKNKNLKAKECKTCHSKIRKNYYENNKKKEIQRTSLRKQDMKEWYQNLKKELCCNRCPENHPSCLEFHHKDPSIKDFSLGHAKMYSFEKVKSELDKCILVCANCHREIHGGIVEIPPV